MQQINPSPIDLDAGRWSVFALGEGGKGQETLGLNFGEMLMQLVVPLGPMIHRGHTVTLTASLDGQPRIELKILAPEAKGN